MAGVMHKIGAWIDRELYEMGLTRKDLRYYFRWRGRKYYIPTFNPLWWIVTVGVVALGTAAFYVGVVLMILVGGGFPR